MADISGRNWKLLIGDVRERLADLPDAHFHCCVTSPPYFGLRDYGTGTWEGGDPECDHTGTRRGHGDDEKQATSAGTSRDGQIARNCRACGATRVDRQIGLEPTPDDFVAAMVAVFREVRRVLRDDGTLWLNLGDSYNAYNGNRGKSTSFQAATEEACPSLPGGHGLTCKTMKPKDLMGIPWRVALALQADGWFLRSDIIWCLSGGARVYARTQKGDMPMTIKDLVRLDPSTVQLWNGKKWTRVLGWNRSPDASGAIEIELRSGERIGCTPGHQWPTNRGLLRASELAVGDVIDSCPILPPPEKPRSPLGLPDDIGWFVGLYIAEGSRSDDTIQIASHANQTERFDRLCRIAADYHGTCRMHATGGNSATVNLNGPMLNAIIDTYVSGRTAKDKHLNVRCWQRSIFFLEAVLEGYLHGDGHHDKKNNRWRLGFCENDNLAADLRTVCARVGAVLSLRRCVHQRDGQKYPGYRGEVRFSRSGHQNQRQASEIVALRPSRARQFWDIGVEDEPHLFALASGVLTHNSKPNPMPESVTDRPTKAHEYIFLLSKSPAYYFDAHAISEPAVHAGETRTTTAKSFAGQATGAGVKPSGNAIPGSVVFIKPTRNARTVWNIATQSYSEAHFACVDAETECLTLTGWKRHNELRAGDVAAQYDIKSGCLSWGAVESVATYEVESQPMVSVQSRDLSMLLTPNHRTIISRRHPKTRHYQPRVVIRADELKTGHAIPVGGEWSATGSNVGVGESMAELLGWYVAEGYERKAGNTVDIYQSLAANPLKVDRIRHLLKAAGASFTETVQEREWRGRPATMVCFTISDDVAVSLRRLAPGKSLSWGYLGLPENEIAGLLRGLVDGDGHTRKDDGRLCFIQKNKSLIDLVQALAIRLGYSTRVSPRKGCETFALYMTKKKRISLRGTGGAGVEITETPHTGVVWCPKLPQGTWVARRHGRVFITGNTFPEEIPARCIKAGTSEKGCCPECGKPWERIVVKSGGTIGQSWHNHENDIGRGHRGGDGKNLAADLYSTYRVESKGWQPCCDCGSEPVPCRVLEPFAGSGTTLKVAVELGREAVGVELNPEYAAMAQRRITNPQKWAAANHKPVKAIEGQRTMFGA